MQNERLTANQINRHIKQHGVIIRRCAGYYYWDAVDKTKLTAAESVYVFSASQLPLSQWVEMAKEAASKIY